MNIDNVRPSRLITASYWEGLTWEHLLILGGQLSVRLLEWQLYSDKLDKKTTEFFKANLRLKFYKRAKAVLDEHLRTGVPHWMAEEANAYFNHIIRAS